MQLKFLKTPPRSGWSSKPFGRFIFQPQSTFLAPNLMSPRQTRFIKQIFFFLPHDTLGRGRGRKTYKYALTVFDVASRFKEAEPLTSKGSAEVAKSFEKIYRCGPLKWPQLLQVDPGREFIGAVTKEMRKKITLLFHAGALKFTEIRLLLKDSTAP